MPSPEDPFHCLGTFDPMEAKQVLPALESAGIPFEVEADHSALGRPGRTFELALGMYPEGSKLAVFVPEAHLPQAQALLQRIFPM